MEYVHVCLFRSATGDRRGTDESDPVRGAEVRDHRIGCLNIDYPARVKTPDYAPSEPLHRCHIRALKWP